MNKKAHCTRVAMANEQKQNGFLREYADYMGYNVRWAYMQKEMIGNEPIQFYDLIINGKVNTGV